MDESENLLDEATNCVASDPERSLEICEQYLKKHPNDPRGLFCRFQAWDELGEFEKARADIDQVIMISPTWIDYFARGAFFHNFGHYQKAIDDLTRARTLDAEGSAIQNISCYRADSLARLGRVDEALADCAFLPDDHWMPGQNGLPAGNKEQFTQEIERRAGIAQTRQQQ